MALTEDMKDYHEHNLNGWKDQMNTHFSVKEGSILMNQIAILVYATELTMVYAKTVESAKKLARSVVHHMHTK